MCLRPPNLKVKNTTPSVSKHAVFVKKKEESMGDYLHASKVKGPRYGK